MSGLDLARIQGVVVRGYRLPLARYLFVRVTDVDRAARWIAQMCPEVLTAATWTQKPDSGLNIAVTFAGLRALALPDASLAGFPEDFRQGMAARAQRLGDTGDSAPLHWPGGGEIHLLLMISAAHDAALSAHEQRLRAGLETNGGLVVVWEETGAALPGGREHFGYADGFAQPAIEGAAVAPRPGQGAPLGGGQWRPIRAGEFILGYLDEENALPPAPPPDELSRNGTYIAYRKLHQDVAGFRRLVGEAAAVYPGSEEMLAAKIVGRWPDGTPLDRAPRGPDGTLAADARRNNAFDYGQDPGGLRCPVGAHIRRANPRLSLPFTGQLVNRHRMIRRGIPYGPVLAPDAPDDGEDRGMLFMSMQASLARQFEFVQSQWLNGGNSLRLGEDQDVLLGPQDTTATAKMTVPGQPPFFVGPLARLVTVRGGEYFFMPGVNGLQFVAAAAGGGAA